MKRILKEKKYEKNFKKNFFFDFFQSVGNFVLKKSTVLFLDFPTVYEVFKFYFKRSIFPNVEQFLKI